jgi:hypothetical protein
VLLHHAARAVNRVAVLAGNKNFLATTSALILVRSSFAKILFPNSNSFSYR